MANKKVELQDVTVWESVLGLTNIAGKAAWWATNAVGSVSKEGYTAALNSKEGTATNFLAHNNYEDVGIHGSNKGFKAVDGLKRAFGTSEVKKTTNGGLGIKS